MSNTLDNCRVLNSATGAADIICGAAYSTSYFTEVAAGVEDGLTYVYRINRTNGDVEIGYGVYTASGRTLERNVKKSIISGVAGTTKLTLDGTEDVQFVIDAEGFDGKIDSPLTAVHLSASAAGGNVINGHVRYTASGTTLTVALKTDANNDPSAGDPVWVRVRDATLTTDAAAWLKITAPLSLVVSSGSSLGAISATAFRVWTVLFNDAGTPRLGVINCLSGTTIYPLGTWPVASSTAEGGAGAADSTQVFYTDSAVAAKPYAVLGYATWETGLSVAGTWNLDATRVKLFDNSVPLPGRPTGNVVHTFSGTHASTTAAIPLDNTKPQSSEGTQAMSRSITPTSAANLLEVSALGRFGISGTLDRIVAALFRDSDADAVAAGYLYSGNQFGGSIALEYVVLAGMTTSTAFKMRYGDTAGATTSFNGYSGTAYFDGAAGSHMKIQELMG